MAHAYPISNFMERYLLNQTINIATRGSNILDLMLTNKHDLVLDALANDSLLSDHKVLKLLLPYNFTRSYKTPYSSYTTDEKSFRKLDFSKANFAKLSSEFDSIDWKAIQHSSHPDSFALKFIDLVLEI